MTTKHVPHPLPQGRSVAVASALLIACAALTPSAVDLTAQEASDEAAIRELVENVAATMEGGQLEALDDVFADGRGVHIIEGAGVNHGWADYRDHHLKPELESFENFSYRYYSVEPVVRDDVAWASFQYDLSVDTERGRVEMEGRGTAVLERVSGTWKIVHLHTSGRPKR